VPPPLPFQGEDATLPLPQRSTVRLPGRGWIWGGCGGLRPRQLCVVLHVLSPQFSGGRDPAASQDRRRRTPKILYLANHMRYMLGGASLDASWRLVSRGFGDLAGSALQSGPFDHGMITGRTRFTVNGSSDPHRRRGRTPISQPRPPRVRPLEAGGERRSGSCRRWALDGPPTVAGRTALRVACCSRPSCCP
jgi:hypothetical protein